MSETEITENKILSDTVREIINKKINRRYEENKEYFKNRSRNIYADLDRKEIIKQRNLDYYHRNREIINEKNKQKYYANKLKKSNTVKQIPNTNVVLNASE